MDQAPRFTEGGNKDSQKERVLNDASKFRELVNLVKRELGQEVLNTAREITEKFRKDHPFPSPTEIRKKSSEFLKDSSAVIETGKYNIDGTNKNYSVDFYVDFAGKIFNAYFDRFFSLVKALPVIDDMARFTKETNTVVDFNAQQFIFPYGVYRVKRDFSKNKDLGSRDEAERYKNELSREGDIVRDALSLEGKINPLRFIEADIKTQLCFKVLDNIFNCISGGIYPPETQSIYKSAQPFEDALAEQLIYVARKWNSLAREDRIAWLAGKFTQSEDAVKGHYEVINLAGANY
ncbi:MAG: hypothetical protein G01um101433_221 [Parcubacteria group bacterium Gr01-1014_33]|nr:MAG: hypothetical protein G01um101433_221 [Parcubacteria group bacterium Gr01-1014_33]